MALEDIDTNSWVLIPVGEFINIIDDIGVDIYAPAFGGLTRGKLDKRTFHPCDVYVMHDGMLLGILVDSSKSDAQGALVNPRIFDEDFLVALKL